MTGPLRLQRTWAPLAVLVLPSFVSSLTACPGPFWSKICLGGTSDPSEACVVADGSMVAIVGGVAGAHALNHDPYDAAKDALASKPPVDAGATDDCEARAYAELVGLAMEAGPDRSVPSPVTLRASDGGAAVCAWFATDGWQCSCQSTARIK